MENLKKLLGKRIRELRKRYNISQQELAEKINIDPRNLSNIETGRTFPSKSLIEIANALDVELTELFKFEHLKTTKAKMAKYINTAIDSMNEEELKIIYKFIKSIRE